jgi:nucleotidyltransferase substrate binding protein (TIGR01987 family)
MGDITNMMLDLTSFEKAIKSLDEILIRFRNESSDTAVRDAVIKRFEYTYELSHKILRRYLEITEPSKENWTFNDLIRIGNKNGLLKSPLEKWEVLRKERNTTSHTYDEDKAQEVINVAADLYWEAAHLLQELKRRQQSIK